MNLLISLERLIQAGSIPGKGWWIQDNDVKFRTLCFGFGGLAQPVEDIGLGPLDDIGQSISAMYGGCLFEGWAL